jgi:hypothetical protein
MGFESTILSFEQAKTVLLIIIITFIIWFVRLLAHSQSHDRCVTVQNHGRLIKAHLEVDDSDDEITYFKNVH